MAFIVSLLALSAVLSPFHTLGITNSSFTPSLRRYPAGIDCLSANLEEVQVNLFINQLAIMSILNETRASSGPNCEVNEGEIQQLKQSLASLNDTVTAQGPASEVNEREIQEMKQSLASLNDAVSAQGHEIEEQKRDIEEQKREIEELKREIEEQKTENEEQKTEIELLKEIIATTIEEDCSVEGDLHVNDDCSISVCHQGFLHPYKGSSAPNVSFSDLLAKNCIHLERDEKSWDAARANCVALGGDLFVAGDFMGAMQYLKEQYKSPGLTSWPWVGVKRREWINGRPVASGEWYGSNPDGSLDYCAYLYGDGLRDARCSNTWTSLCVKGTTY